MTSPKFELLKYKVLDYFPSASAINYHEEKLFLIGDDAAHLLVLDCEYERVKSLVLFESETKRIPKKQKVDLEAAVMLIHEGGYEVMAFGSGSKEKRKTIIKVLSKDNQSNITAIGNEVFIGRLVDAGVEEINLEGSTLMRDVLILSNRGNRSNPQNHLICTTLDFFERPAEAEFSIIEVNVPDTIPKGMTISDVCYLESMDMMLFTLTSEDTDNAYDDGAIGNSYLAWVNDFSKSLGQRTLNLDHSVNLFDVNRVFMNEKIEGVCVAHAGSSEIILHLVSDNDNGESKIFKINVSFS